MTKPVDIELVERMLGPGEQWNRVAKDGLDAVGTALE
jgi:hypothetical protein